MTNVLVTGGCGVVGSRIALRFAEQQGFKVEVLDACEEPRNEWIRGRLESKGVVVWKARLEDSAADNIVLKNIDQFDLVVHAAAWTGIPSSAENPEDDWVSNVEATRCLVRALQKAERKPYTVVLSSVKPYDLAGALYAEDTSKHRYAWDNLAWRFSEGVSEQWPLDPDEPYAASKMAQSALCIAYARTFGLPITVFRCSNLYGPAPSHGPRHGWFTWFAISAAIGRPITVQGSGLQARDMLHADDVFAACVAAAAHPETCSGQLFNLGGGHPNVVGVGNAARDFAKMGGVELLRAEGRKFEDPIFVTDHRKFTKATGWNPSVYASDGGVQVFEWARENREELVELYKDVP